MFVEMISLQMELHKTM